MVSWTKEAKDKAKADGRWMYKVHMMGRWAESGSVFCSGTLSSARMLRVMEILGEQDREDREDTVALRREGGEK